MKVVSGCVVFSAMIPPDFRENIHINNNIFLKLSFSWISHIILVKSLQKPSCSSCLLLVFQAVSLQTGWHIKSKLFRTRISHTCRSIKIQENTSLSDMYFSFDGPHVGNITLHYMKPPNTRKEIYDWGLRSLQWTRLSHQSTCTDGILYNACLCLLPADVQFISAHRQTSSKTDIQVWQRWCFVTCNNNPQPQTSQEAVLGSVSAPNVKTEAGTSTNMSGNRNQFLVCHHASN